MHLADDSWALSPHLWWLSGSPSEEATIVSYLCDKGEEEHIIFNTWSLMSIRPLGVSRETGEGLPWGAPPSGEDTTGMKIGHKLKSDGGGYFGGRMNMDRVMGCVRGQDLASLRRCP